jgi:hypothetical protein
MESEAKNPVKSELELGLLPSAATGFAGPCNETKSQRAKLDRTARLTPYQSARLSSVTRSRTPSSQRPAKNLAGNEYAFDVSGPMGSAAFFTNLQVFSAQQLEARYWRRGDAAGLAFTSKGPWK